MKLQDEQKIEAAFEGVRGCSSQTLNRWICWRKKLTAKHWIVMSAEHDYFDNGMNSGFFSINKLQANTILRPLLF